MPSTPEEESWNQRAIRDLADIVICGKDSDEDNDKVCDHDTPGQWVCRSCTNANWECRTACRRCARLRSPSDWYYPARRVKTVTKPSAPLNRNIEARPCADCGLFTDSFCESCCISPGQARNTGQASFTKPLCERCAEQWVACYRCRTGPAHRPSPSQQTPPESQTPRWQKRMAQANWAGASEQ